MGHARIRRPCIRRPLLICQTGLCLCNGMAACEANKATHTGGAVGVALRQAIIPCSCHDRQTKRCTHQAEDPRSTATANTPKSRDTSARASTTWSIARPAPKVCCASHIPSVARRGHVCPPCPLSHPAAAHPPREVQLRVAGCAAPYRAAQRPQRAKPRSVSRPRRRGRWGPFLGCGEAAHTHLPLRTAASTPAASRRPQGSRTRRPP
mmetsp:Transcript_106721/g.311990  ORF Transcript_106721/g.311990 Transcript_106721/m.311990 type:complete len:208 (+) Transcript_106721:2680-3303(+)